MKYQIIKLFQITYDMISVGSKEVSSQDNNLEIVGYESSDAITSKPQIQQDINKDVVDLSAQKGCHDNSQTLGNDSSIKDKKSEIDDFYTNDQLLSTVKKR